MSYLCIRVVSQSTYRESRPIALIFGFDIKYANLSAASETLEIKLCHQKSLNVALKSGCFSLCSFTNKFHFVRRAGVVAFTVCSEM